MKGSKVFLVLSILVVSIVAVSGTAFALAPEYMRNGECYLLVGHDDVNFRGVYRLNNPSGEPDGNPINVKLYDPRTSHGISVNLNRNVYTFSENTDPTSTYDSAWVLSRLLKVPGGVSLYGAHCDTRKNYYVSTEGVTYNQSNQPVYTTTGPMGNETGTAADGSHNISWEWSGTVSVLTKEAARWKVGKTVVKCDNGCTWGNGLSDRYWVYFVSTDAAGYGNVPNGALVAIERRRPAWPAGQHFLLGPRLQKVYLLRSESLGQDHGHLGSEQPHLRSARRAGRFRLRGKRQTVPNFGLHELLLC